MNIASLGSILLFLALCAAVYNVVATIAAYRMPEENRQLTLASAHNAARAVFGLLTLASAILIALFLTNDFSIEYVWGQSSRSQPIPYKIAAWWGGQSGSLLFWAWVLSLYILLMSFMSRRGTESSKDVASTAIAIASGVNLLFLGLIVFLTSPFAKIAGGVIPADGRGLNPLLQNYWMQIHPPALYLGFVGCTVPFAFAMSALLHRRFDQDWVALVRRWTLFTWIILTIGIALGGVWAYETLGWGGYWAWDPVENASLMPWFTATAFLHSIMLQSQRGTLKNWNIVLVTLTFLLSIFGTFLTRSGIVSSVHSFAASGIGGYFLAFLALCLMLSLALIVWRSDELKSTLEFESAFSREGAFLLNNWLLVGAAAAVLWGTVFPSISEELFNQRLSVGPPYFNKVMAPIGLALLALAGIGPLLSWRRASSVTIRQVLRVPLILAICSAPLLLFFSHWRTGAATAFVLAVFVMAAIVSEFLRGARARQAMTGEVLGRSLTNLVFKNRQRYGGYIVHIGVVLMFVGITGSNVFKIETDPIELKPGETLKIGEYTLVYKGLKPTPTKLLSRNKEREVAANIQVMRNGRQVGELLPTIDFYKAVNMGDEVNAEPQQTARRPAIMSNPAHDLYLAMTNFDDKSGVAEIKAYLNPLVMWIWISMAFFIGGTVVAMLPHRRRAHEPIKLAQRERSGARPAEATPAAVIAATKP